jgi:hypothetical protein
MLSFFPPAELVSPVGGLMTLFDKMPRCLRQPDA